ncbi:MAG: helix-turn-helix domain-containing protein [Acidobacteria bacterium]|nr:helix-turn-helix domain-containing protein [Acidobacteriota bacterium]
MGKKRKKITVEIERSLVIRKRGGAVHAWCAGCAEQVRMLTPEESALAAGVTVRTIYRWVEAGKLHFIESPDGLLLICFNSLVRDR